MEKFVKYLYPHQQEAIQHEKTHDKCLFNMWCGTGKTRVFTISMFIDDLNFVLLIRSFL
jgi:superfamily II DNA or RNA helicase